MSLARDGDAAFAVELHRSDDGAADCRPLTNSRFQNNATSRHGVPGRRTRSNSTLPPAAISLLKICCLTGPGSVNYKTRTKKPKFLSQDSQDGSTESEGT